MRNLTALALLAAAPVAPAAAQTDHCAPRDVVVERLALSYDEVFSGGGMQSGDAVYEVWVAEATGTWTILRTDATGTSCIMAAGTDWFPGLAGAQVAGIPS